MPFIRSLTSKRHAYLITLILSLGVIIPSYSYYTKKRLVCVTIVAFFSYQPSSYFECMKLNMYFFYNIKSVSNAKYIFLIYLTNF